MTDLSFEIRFIGTGLPGGVIDAADLARICAALQELASRVGRWVFDAADVGRLSKAPEEVTRVRVTGLAQGSTRLCLSTGSAQGSFHSTSPLADRTNELFWGIVRGSGTRDFPKDAPGPVRRTALEFVKALDGPAPKVEVRATSPGFDPDPVTFAPKNATASAWFKAEPEAAAETTQTVSGTLEMVNLHTGRFRIRDSVNTTFDLVDVPHAMRAAQLVGQVVAATGSPASGRARTITGPELRPVGLPEWATDSSERENHFRESVASAEPYDPSTGPAFELSDGEWAAFWAAIRGE
jgi:hypothetical protein